MTEVRPENQNENFLREEKLQQTIENLKSDLERIQDRGSNEKKTLRFSTRFPSLSELQWTRKSNEEQLIYEKRIEEYEDQLKQAAEKTEQVQNQMNQLENEKSSLTEKSNQIIESLKLDHQEKYQNLLAQFNELKKTGSSIRTFNLK